MRKAWDEHFGKIVYAEDEDASITVTADSHRYSCLCCREYVTKSRGTSNKVPYFRHTKGNALECEERVATGDYDPMTFNPEYSFALPIYLTGWNRYELKIGFLPRTTGQVILRDKLGDDAKLKLEYNVSYNHLNHYIYLSVSRKSPEYILQHNGRKYVGEGISDVNIFLERTRRRVRNDKIKESIYANSRYILLIKKESTVYRQIINKLLDSSCFIKGPNFDFDNERYESYNFIVETESANFSKICSVIQDDLKYDIKKKQVDLRFYWPLNYSYHEKKIFIYDDELYVKTRNLTMLKTNSGIPLTFEQDKPFIYKLKGYDGMVGWNNSSGCMYQLEVIKPVNYKTIKPLIEFYDIETEEKIDNVDLSKTSSLGVRANVKCLVIRFSKGYSVTKLESDGFVFASKEFLISNDDIALYVVYNDKVYIKAERTINLNKNRDVLKLDIKKVLTFASSNDFVRTNITLIDKISYIENQKVKIIVKNAIVKGFISNKLQQYLLEVLQ